ncbi:hypothetical protein ACLOJK_032753 [Asimina triloba]
MTDPSKMRVTVRGKMTAVSSTPVKPGKTYPLSVLDHLMACHHLRLVFYYNPSQSVDSENLRDSLSDVLSYYPAITGRLKRAEDGNWEVKCTDAGVRVLEATVDCTLDEWLRSAHASQEQDLTHWEDLPEDPYIWSPFYIQLKNPFKTGWVSSQALDFGVLSKSEAI